MFAENRLPQTVDYHEPFQHMIDLSDLRTEFLAYHEPEDVHYPTAKANRAMYDSYRQMYLDKAITREQFTGVAVALLRKERWATVEEYSFVYNYSLSPQAISNIPYRFNKLTRDSKSMRFVSFGNAGPQKEVVLDRLPVTVRNLFNNKYMLVKYGKHPDNIGGLERNQYLANSEDNQNFIAAMTGLVWKNMDDPKSQCDSLLTFTERILLYSGYLLHDPYNFDELKQRFVDTMGFAQEGVSDNYIAVNLARIRAKLQAKRVPLPYFLDDGRAARIIRREM